MTRNVRQWYVNQAVESLSRLHAVLPEMTEAEVLAALRLESQAMRRKSILDRLTSRAVRLMEIRYATKLKEKYHHGT